MAGDGHRCRSARSGGGVPDGGGRRGFVTHVLTSCGEVVWAALARGLAQAATCADLAAAYAGATVTAAGHLLAAVAALIYRLQPKVRLM